MPIARNISIRAVFATSSFNFGLPTYFVSHCCYGKSCFSKKAEQSCLTVVWQTTCQRSHIFLCASCRHHVFVLLGSVALDHLKINFAWLCLRLVSLSFKKTTVHINRPYSYSRYWTGTRMQWRLMWGNTIKKS